MKPKICKNKNCKKKFIPTQFAQVVCDWKCSIEYVEQQKLKNSLADAKKKRRVYVDTKNKLKSLTELSMSVQRVFNAWIRERDKHLPCISCQRHHNGRYHAGHYRTTKAASNLRFNEDNCHKQCAPCNNNLSGNIVNYRINLIAKIGIERVEAIENSNETKRWTKEELLAIKEDYSKRLKDLKGWAASNDEF